MEYMESRMQDRYEALSEERRESGRPGYTIAHGSAAVQAARIIAGVAKAKTDATENEKIARARRALERIRNVGKDRSEKLYYRVDDMVDEAEEALRFLSLPTTTL